MTESAPLHTVRQDLLTRRRSLAVKLAELMAPPDDSVGVGFGKRIGDGTTEAVDRISSTLTARSINDSIKEIDAVIDSIDAGTYGLCEVCGDTIPAERLAARPSSLRCVGCASG
jgi:RNA polymerase-binding transcription factor DksA